MYLVSNNIIALRGQCLLQKPKILHSNRYHHLNGQIRLLNE